MIIFTGNILYLLVWEKNSKLVYIIMVQQLLLYKPPFLMVMFFLYKFILVLFGIQTVIIGIMEFDQVVRKRKMIREYLPDKQIPEEIITKLINNAHRAPSAGHSQVQEFIIIKDSVTKKRLREAALNQEYVEKADALIVVCSNVSRSVKRYGKRGREFYSIIDGAFASMLILLTAVNEGIGAGFVGAFEDDKVSKILGLPEYVKPIGIITLGYSSESPERLKRIDIDRLVHYEKYGND